MIIVFRWLFLCHLKVSGTLHAFHNDTANRMVHWYILEFCSCWRWKTSKFSLLVGIRTLGDIWIGLWRTEPGTMNRSLWETENRKHWIWIASQGSFQSFAWWAPAEPSGESWCASMKNYGEIKDTDCNHLYEFVCEGIIPLNYDGKVSSAMNTMVYTLVHLMHTCT